jgi:hypothetical protein
MRRGLEMQNAPTDGGASWFVPRLTIRCTALPCSCKPLDARCLQNEQQISRRRFAGSLVTRFFEDDWIVHAAELKRNPSTQKSALTLQIVGCILRSLTVTRDETLMLASLAEINNNAFAIGPAFKVGDRGGASGSWAQLWLVCSRRWTGAVWLRFLLGESIALRLCAFFGPFGNHSGI